MPPESIKAKPARLKKIIASLQKTYPGCSLRIESFQLSELLVATILSAQCTDKRVNVVTAGLFKKYRTAADYAKANPVELEQEIKTTGFYRNKAKNIQACCRKLVERHGGEVPQTMEELTHLDGVGRKTANVILGNAFGINEGIVVDTHVARCSHRLVFDPPERPGDRSTELMKFVPREQMPSLMPKAFLK